MRLREAHERAADADAGALRIRRCIPMILFRAGHARRPI